MIEPRRMRHWWSIGERKTMVDMTETPVPFTLRSAAGLPSHPLPLAESALVIIDAQIEYGHDDLLPLAGLDEALTQITRLLERARSTGSPVIHVVHEGAAGGAFDPAVGGRVLPEVAPIAGEVVVKKKLPNAFAGTDLLEHVGGPLTIVGFMTHMCVSSTARAALDLGLATTIVSDATSTRSLPAADGGDAIPAETVHRSALAALADRFSVVAEASVLLDGPPPGR